MLLDTVLDILEILGILTVLIAVASLILAPGGPKGVIKLIREPPVIPVIGIKQIFAWYGRILIPISLVLILIFLISAGGIIDQLGTNNWSESEATVIQSEIESETSCSYDESVGYDTCSTRDWLVVTYSYQVGRENYTSDRYTFIDDLDPSEYSEYPLGRTLTIFVDPGDPSESVMIKGFMPVWEEVLAASFFFVLITILTTYFLAFWKIGYHIQPAANRAKAREAPNWEWRGFKELFSSSQLGGVLNLMRQATQDVYDGSSKDLVVEIDGKRGSHTIKNMNDILELLQRADNRAVVYFEDSMEEGRSVSMDVIDVERYTIELTESIGSDSVRNLRFDLEDNWLPLIEFIKTAISNSDQEQGNWWN